jgi:Flp pilus assembly protein TadD
VTARIYASPDFLTRRPGERAKPMRFAVPKDPAALAAVDQSLFLRRMLARWQSEYARAVVLLREGRSEAAAAMLEDVVVMAPDNAHARAKLGEAYLGVGRSAEARVQFERALRLSPALADARAGLERAQSAPPPG